MDPKLFEAARAAALADAAPAPAETAIDATPQIEVEAPEQVDFSHAAGDLTDAEKAHYQSVSEPGLGHPDNAITSFAGGLVKGALETKDFFTGETPKDEMWPMRRDFEKSYAHTKDEGIISGVAAGFGQFAIGMIGVGKMQKAVELTKLGRAGIAAMESTKLGGAAFETGKAALAGVMSTDPWEERLSNMIQGTALANPVTGYLAADPTDSVAAGRLKGALESIGLDATIGGVLVGGLAVFRHLKAGNTEGARAAAEALEAEAKGASAPEAPASDTGSGVSNEATPIREEPLPAGVAAKDAPVMEEAAPTGGSTAKTEPAAPPTNPADEVDAQLAQSPTDAADAAGVDLQGTPTPSAQPAIRFSDEDTEAVLKGMESDMAAMETYGGWDEAIEAGHVFGKGEGVPYDKLNQDADLDDFMARMVDAAEERLATLKGGDILHDADVTQLVGQRAKLFNEDPATLIGMLQQSGKMAARMVADMEAGYLVTARILQDTFALAERIKLGDFTQFGSREAATAELKRRLSMAASVYGASRSITANAGRAVRRMRLDFALDPDAVAKLMKMDDDALVEAVSSTGGDTAALAKLSKPTMWQQSRDLAFFVYINNLMSGWKTHIFNLAGNAYMIGARPLERILGSVPGALVGNAASRSIMKSAIKQYTYMGAAFRGGFSMARKSFVINDSILAPRRTEAHRVGQASAHANVAAMKWKDWGSVGGLLHNSFQSYVFLQGMPTRMLGFVDEMVKQTVYRSKIMADTHVAAAEQGIAAGLKGADLEAFVKDAIEQKLAKSFDDLGRALDPDALLEAQITTFSQDLAPRTAGALFQSVTHNFPLTRFVLPFVKTPTNVLRYGWKMTPGLNLLQGEYRHMLMGRMGAEAQAQAVGQLALGSLFMGTASYLVSQGSITGAGPDDYKLQQELRATGWQPYSIVKQNADGSKTYIPFNRFDPVAIPFGIIADMQDAIAALGEDADGKSALQQVGDASSALTIALAKQFSNKSYLLGIQQFMDALEDPDDNMWRLVGQTAANFVPFSAALRQNNPDDLLREARSVADRVKAGIPGLSSTLPARYDAFGEPIRVRKGLWSSDENLAIEREVQRLAVETGSSVMRVSPTVGGVDLRDITMADGRNAYEVYQQYSGRLPGQRVNAKQRVSRLIATEAYQNAPDGDASTKGTKLYRMTEVLAKQRQAALAHVRRDPNVSAAMTKKRQAVSDHYARQKAARGTPDIGTAFGTDTALQPTE